MEDFSTQFTIMPVGTTAWILTSRCSASVKRGENYTSSIEREIYVAATSENRKDLRKMSEKQIDIRSWVLSCASVATQNLPLLELKFRVDFLVLNNSLITSVY